MTSVAAIPSPLHRLEDQPVNLISSSNENWLLNGAMDQEDVKVSSRPEHKNGETTTAAAETPMVIPPFQPESHVVKNNKAVPWYDSYSLFFRPFLGSLLSLDLILLLFHLLLKIARYHTSAPSIDPITRELLENYSQIPSHRVVPHVSAIVSLSTARYITQICPPNPKEIHR